MLPEDFFVFVEFLHHPDLCNLKNLKPGFRKGITLDEKIIIGKSVEKLQKYNFIFVHI